MRHWSSLSDERTRGTSLLRPIPWHFASKTPLPQTGHGKRANRPCSSSLAKILLLPPPDGRPPDVAATTRSRKANKRNDVRSQIHAWKLRQGRKISHLSLRHAPWWCSSCAAQHLCLRVWDPCKPGKIQEKKSYRSFQKKGLLLRIRLSDCFGIFVCVRTYVCFAFVRTYVHWFFLLVLLLLLWISPLLSLM